MKSTALKCLTFFQDLPDNINIDSSLKNPIIRISEAEVAISSSSIKEVAAFTIKVILELLSKV